MDKLTEKGLEYINENKDMLATLALGYVVEHSKDCPREYDDWVSFDFVKGCWAYSESEIEDTIDLNIWLPDDIEDELQNWKAGAYPMEINSEGEVQTDTQDFVRLF